MRKSLILLMLFLSIMFLMVLNVKAVTQISSVSMDGQDTVNVGDVFYEQFHIKFSDFKQDDPDTLGIWMVAYEIDYNDNDFAIDDISSNDNIWDSVILKEDGKTYVISQFSNNLAPNTCIGNQLYCAEYAVNIKITVKDTSAQTSTIIIKQIEAAAFKIYEEYEYSLDDAVELDYNYDAIKVLSIRKNEDNNSKENENNVANNLDNVEPARQYNNNSTIDFNVNLKSLEIENYNIDFKSNVKTYNINIDDDVNTLNVFASADDDNASIEIIGADNLKNNNYKVAINIYLENELKNTYTINTLVTNEDDEKNDRKGNSFKIDKKTGLFLIIGGVLVAIIIIVVIVLNYISNKRIDKGLDF